MKKLLLLTILIPQLVFAQNNSSIDIAIGLNSSYRTLTDTENSEFTNTIYEARQTVEEKKVKYAIGIHFNKPFTGNWHLRTGIRYTMMGYESDFASGIQWLIQKFGGETVNYSFIDIPILFRKTFSDKNLSPFFEFGIAPNYLVSLNGHDSSQVFNKFQLAGILSAGINYTFNNFQVYFQPTFRYHITGIIRDATLKEHLYNGGIEIGMRKLFGTKDVK